MINNSILVAGATGGIGEAVTRGLLKKGYSVIALSHNLEKLEEKFSEDKQCACLEFDLMSLDEIPSLIKDISKKYGSLGGLVYCAGHDKLSPLYLSKRKNIESLLFIHAVAPILLCGQMAKKRIAVEGSAIVLISSLAAHEGAAGHSAYAAAKGALEGFLPSAAAELADKKIRINIVVPGVIKTEMSAGFIDKLSEEQRISLEESYPLGLGEPSDVSKVIEFLIGDDSKWITGQKIIVDGGHLSRKV